MRVVASSAPDPVITAVGTTRHRRLTAEDIAVKNAVGPYQSRRAPRDRDFQYDNIGTIISGYDKIWGPKPEGLYPIIYPTAGPTHDVTSCTDARYQTIGAESGGEDLLVRPRVRGTSSVCPRPLFAIAAT